MIVQLIDDEVADGFHCFSVQTAELRCRERTAEGHFRDEFLDVFPLFGKRLPMVFQHGGAVHAGENGNFSWKSRYNVHGISAACEGFDVKTEFRMHAADAFFIEKDTAAVWLPSEIFMPIDGDGEVVGIWLPLPVEIGEAKTFLFFQTDMETSAAPSAHEAAVMLMLRNLDFIFWHGRPV